MSNPFRGLSRLKSVLVGAVSLVILCSLVGFILEPRFEAADLRRFPAPGELIQVGDHRLHLNCQGSGSPTVVIDAGAGDWSASWAVVQREIAELTKVCTYDRAGYGWSEPAPGPMTARQSAGELHALLERAGVPGPFVLAGHSAGGLTVRLFAHNYPEEVAGVVFIDSMTPDEHASGSGEQVRSGRSILESILPSLARLGFMRALSVPLTMVKVLPGTQSQIASSVTPRFFSAVQDEYLGLSGSLAQASKVRSLGDLPVIVLSASLGNDATWQKKQTSLLGLSTSSEQMFAEHSGHNIQEDQPQAAIAAISKMAGQIRSEGSR